MRIPAHPIASHRNPQQPSASFFCSQSLDGGASNDANRYCLGGKCWVNGICGLYHENWFWYEVLGSFVGSTVFRPAVQCLQERLKPKQGLRHHRWQLVGNYGGKGGSWVAVFLGDESVWVFPSQLLLILIEPPCGMLYCFNNNCFHIFQVPDMADTHTNLHCPQLGP